jgi:hypothetical protein
VNASLIVSILTLVIAIVGFVVSLIRIQSVHVLVNAQLSEVMGKLDAVSARRDQLRTSLVSAGVPVPEKLAEQDSG